MSPRHKSHNVIKVVVAKMSLCTNGITILIVCSNDMAGQMSRGNNVVGENVSGTKV
jgi:hypothetical protein